jgi:7,8-didemethyl-8-hydroxy-5-deazariboflavin synthase
MIFIFRKNILNMLSTTKHTNIHEILEKCLEGKRILKIDAYNLINSVDSINAILDTARKIRDRNKIGPITYSRKVFINLVNLCRDTCSYCTYKKEPYDNSVTMMKPEEVLAIAESGRRFHCTEALFVTGEKPEQKYLEAKAWLKSVRCSSTVEYINQLSEMILKKTGLLPHTNAGSLTKKDMSLLKETNVSLGMMLESSSQRLSEKGMPHEKAPSKNPKVRLKALENAGQLKIPLTTGLLVGIGEKPEELIDSLFTIEEINQKYGHIQEVIMQNFAPKPETGMESSAPPTYGYFIKSVAIARIVMPEVNIQVPPNLSATVFGKYLDAGINDWGGISPVTIDYVNPEFPWPSIESIKEVTENRGYKFRARLPVYPEFIVKDNGFIKDTLMNYVNIISDESGLVREDYIN